VSRVEEGEDLSLGGGHHDGVVPHVGAFLPESKSYSLLHLKSEIEVCKLRQK
jgi:hypothetical protein